MRYVPHAYQEEATRFIISHPACALFIQMGLGKTVVTLTAIRELMHARGEVHRVLVVAPLRVARDTWPEELAKWDHLAGLSMAVAVGSAKERLRAIGEDAEVTVINRENLAWLVEESRIPWHWDMVVLDELSGFKSHQSRRFRAMRMVRGEVTRIVGLTGTPAPNGLMDLWAEFRLIDGGERFGRFLTPFRERWFTPDRRNGAVVWSWKPREGAEAEITGRISDITLGMRALDHIAMPSLVTVDRKVALPPQARKAYRDLKRELAAELEGGTVTALSAGALSNKLQQAASGFLYTDDGGVADVHDAKTDALADIIEEAVGQGVLVAYWFREERRRLEEMCITRGLSWTHLDSTEGIRMWKAGEAQVGLIHPASCGHGLNIQSGGHILVWTSLPWSLELYGQTVARLWRQGQEAGTVTVVRLLAEGTIDGRIAAALEAKEAGEDAVFEAVKAELEVKT